MPFCLPFPYDGFDVALNTRSLAVLRPMSMEIGTGQSKTDIEVNEVTHTTTFGRARKRETWVGFELVWDRWTRPLDGMIMMRMASVGVFT